MGGNEQIFGWWGDSPHPPHPPLSMENPVHGDDKHYVKGERKLNLAFFLLQSLLLYQTKLFAKVIEISIENEKICCKEKEAVICWKKL